MLNEREHKLMIKWSNKNQHEAIGLQLCSGDMRVRANRYTSLLFFIIQFPYIQQILC